ncbi:protein O-mannosyl-transferase TMTC1 isoform X1 [Equus quagga]|uniref:protein O-mannosyl-transferase TMTC1 isoform X1 n=1 Tax=Equus quagga TaxID=89248 RepID=UPI001EE247C9|nr:protein O-mannosyl-transferase TMTC1 isoform X1 [Equus quagga]
MRPPRPGSGGGGGWGAVRIAGRPRPDPGRPYPGPRAAPRRALRSTCARTRAAGGLGRPRAEGGGSRAGAQGAGCVERAASVPGLGGWRKERAGHAQWGGGGGDGRGRRGDCCLFAAGPTRRRRRRRSAGRQRRVQRPPHHARARLPAAAARRRGPGRGGCQTPGRGQGSGGGGGAMVVTSSTRGGGGDRAPSRQRGCGLAPAGAAALLAGASCLCYGRSLQGEFVHDDVWAIVNNPDVRPGAPLRWGIFTNDFWGKGMAENTSHKSYRPLCVLTFKLNIFLTGMNPFYFHAVNVILHCLVTLVLMYTCDKTVFKNRGLAFVTALLFAVHPIHTEAVAGIVGRADVLACLLFLLAFLSYNRSVDQCCVGECFPPTASPFFLLLSLFLGTCAMLVKETGITVFGVCLVYDLFSLSHKQEKSSNGVIPHRSPQQPRSPQPSSLPAHPLRENGKQQRFPHKGAWGGCHSPLPPEPKSSGFPVSPRAVWSMMRYLTASSNRNFLLTMRPFLKRAILVISYVIVVLYFRLWMMGGSMPLFSEQDNPASFSPYILTRFLTYSYLLAFNVWLLLAPVTLCYDWQVGSIPLVETIWDVRNLATILLAVVMTLLSLHCLAAFKRLEHKEVLVGLSFLVFPFIPASNLFFRVGFVVAERVLYMPSMGYCILFVHGLSKLCTWLHRCGAATLTASTVLLLLLFSWKTVKQNEIWLSRESLFRSGVQTLPHNAKVHYNYANFLKDQGRNREAVYHYRTAVRLYPRHASALNNLGTLTRDTAEAKMYYQRALQLNPQHNRALFNLGNLLKSQDKKEEAIILLKDSIKYGPEFADAYSSLASLLAEQERFKEAEDIYQAGIKNCPDSSDLHNNYGVFLVDTGSPEKAVAHYQQAITLSPSHHVAMVNLGRLYRSLGDNSVAEEWYKRALQVARKAEILSPLGALYYNTGRYEEALQIYREAAALQPSQRELRLALAQVLAVMGQTKEAEKMTIHIVSEEAGCLECYRLLSAIYSKQELHDKALDAIDKALRLKPKDPKVISELFFTKGNQLREQNLLDKAFESYKAAVELNPDQAQAWMNMGGIQHIKGNYVSARAYYERALQLVPDSKLLQENLAKLDRLEKRLQEIRDKDHT